MMIDGKLIDELKEKSRQVRVEIVRMLNEAGSGHAGGALGMAEVFSALFFGGILKYDSQRPDWEDRDRLIVSNGHINPGLYASMAMAGYFDRRELASLRQLGSRLQGHPHRLALPGLETTSGPLGSGLSQGVGMALGLALDRRLNKVFVIVSDGEQNEGNHWEGVMLASKYKLGNLVAITDRNGIQIDGFTREVMPMEPLADKYAAFGWEVEEIDGNEVEQVVETLQRMKEKASGPTMILAQTVPGKGVSFMENKPEWHGKAPNDEELARALGELGENNKLQLTN